MSEKNCSKAGLHNKWKLETTNFLSSPTEEYLPVSSMQGTVIWQETWNNKPN